HHPVSLGQLQGLSPRATSRDWPPVGGILGFTGTAPVCPAGTKPRNWDALVAIPDGDLGSRGGIYRVVQADPKHEELSTCQKYPRTTPPFPTHPAGEERSPVLPVQTPQWEWGGSWGMGWIPWKWGDPDPAADPRLCPPAREQLRRSRHSRTFLVESGVGELWSEMQAGDRYIVADCGGGTVDLTVHQIEKPQGTLKELYKASGGPYGAVGVDLAFEKLLCRIFGDDFIATFKAKRPAAWVDLTIAFEARKRAAAPSRSSPLNISLPFSFVDFYRKHRGHNVETALRKSNVNLVKWSSQGMLRMSPEVMNELFQPTITHIIQHIDALLKKPEVHGIKFLFLVGGFAESAMLQGAVQAAFGRCCRVIVPQDVGLTILKGAVLFGLDPGVVRVRRSPLTYGVGVLNKFVEGKHPREKLLVKEGKNWCTDIFEKFVAVDQSVALGEVVQRSYCPARPGQRRTIINIYCCDTDDVVYITDPGVRKCGTI
uniref:Heat shock protein family A (Hsp70) member 12B n=1 Tax=Serinus canaria TaxID=9135 RepID=A0A8C9KX52_SERCA